MEFSVNSNALFGLSDMMDRRWENFETARTYLKANTQFSVLNAGLLNDLLGQHQRIVDGIDGFLSGAAQRFAGPCATAVIEANVSYRSSDRNAVNRADAALPIPGTVLWGGGAATVVPPATPRPTGPADQSLDRSVFVDTRCPVGWLQPPPDHRADHPLEPSLLDALSPTTVLRDAIWAATSVAATFGVLDRPYDIVAEVVQPLSGDWSGYLRCADVYDNIAHTIEDAAACVDDGRMTIGRVWTGNAAEACITSMAAFSTNLRAAIDPLHHTAANYRTVAETVRADSEVLAAMLTLLADFIIETGLEAPTGLLEAPYEVIGGAVNLEKVATKLFDVLKIMAKLREFVRAGMSGAESVTAGLGLVWDSAPVPMMLATAPNLSRPAIARFQ
jgi:hypothetical protein